MTNEEYDLLKAMSKATDETVTPEIKEQRESLFQRLISKWPHRYYNVDLASETGQDYENNCPDKMRTPSTISRASVISSAIGPSEMNGQHTFAVDIDFPVTVIESSTPGHYHLYIDKPMFWKDYQRVLEAMAEAGLVEEGYVAASITRGATHLRLPWVKKTTTRKAY